MTRPLMQRAGHLQNTSQNSVRKILKNHVLLLKPIQRAHDYESGALLAERHLHSLRKESAYLGGWRRKKKN